MLLYIVTAYAVGWAATLLLARRTEEDEWEEEADEPWMTAAIWPVIAGTLLVVAVVIAYDALDRALRRSGV